MSDQRFVGILVPLRQYKKIPKLKGRLGKVISFYEEGAKEHGVSLCFFSPSRIDFTKGEITAYVKGKDGYKQRTLPIPHVIYRRALIEERFKENYKKCTIIH